MHISDANLGWHKHEGQLNKSTRIQGQFTEFTEQANYPRQNTMKAQLRLETEKH